MTVTLKNKPPVVVPPAALRRAGFKRGQELEIRASGGVIKIVPKTPSADYPSETVTRIIKEVKESPMNRQQLAALDAQLTAYGAKQAKKVRIKERDIPRIIHESRARCRAS
jgi:hypothetical protein